jgi:hypothetical protein
MEQLARRLQRAEEQIENFLLPDPTIRVLNTLLHVADDSDEGPLELSPLELSTRTALDLDQVKAVSATLLPCANCTIFWLSRKTYGTG